MKKLNTFYFLVLSLFSSTVFSMERGVAPEQKTFEQRFVKILAPFKDKKEGEKDLFNQTKKLLASLDKNPDVFLSDQVAVKNLRRCLGIIFLNITVTEIKYLIQDFEHDVNLHADCACNPSGSYDNGDNFLFFGPMEFE